jgi:hypothetical protein
VFSRDLPDIEGLSKGDILLTRDGQGFARKIRAIERTDDTVTLHLTRAHLNEIVAIGEFYFGPTQRVEFDNGQSYAPPGRFNASTARNGDIIWSERQEQFRPPVKAKPLFCPART